MPRPENDTFAAIARELQAIQGRVGQAAAALHVAELRARALLERHIKARAAGSVANAPLPALENLADLLATANGLLEAMGEAAGVGKTGL